MDVIKNLTPQYTMTSGRILARNTIWNLVGFSVPLLVALFAIPVLIKELGTDRFGILTLIWAVAGYFNLFDLGMGRALTKLVAAKLGAGQEQDVPKLTWTALALMGMLGIVGIFAMAWLSPWLTKDILKISQALQYESLEAFYAISFSIPFVISSAGLRGLLQAYQRFDLINKVRIPLGICIFLGPLAVMPFSNKLLPVAVVLVVVRLLAWWVQVLLCLKVVPGLRYNIRFEWTMVRPLITFGSWMTVSNIISPLMIYCDRFLIGAMISMSAVTFFVTPYEVITKVGLIPSAFVGVLFPAFSTTLLQDQSRAVWLFDRGIIYTFIALFPLTLIFVTLAHEGMTLWLGVEFAYKSSFVLQCLAVGVFINGIATVPFALVQGAGRPDLTAKMHFIELPAYFLTLWWLLGSYGIKGVAIAWVARVTVDLLILSVLAQRLLPGARAIVRNVLLRIIIAVCVFLIAGYITGLLMKGVFLLVTLVGFMLVMWFWLLSCEDRRFLKDFSPYPFSK